MDLRDRLKRLDPLMRAPGKSEYGPAPDRGGVRPVRPSPSDEADLRAALDLRGEGTDGEGVWSRLLSSPHVAPPACPIPDFSAILPGSPPAADDGLNGWQDVLLLDVETTGLSGGAGTLVFLVGLGWWHHEELQIRQFFLPGPHREPAFLDALNAAVSRFRVVVTYNGSAFDLPVLRTRSRLNRRLDTCGGLASWDLLPASRRLWGRALPDCRQQTVELDVCGRRRGLLDIPGGQIPAAYRAFLDTGETLRMTQVLYHNRSDIEGLGLILGALTDSARTIAGGPSCWSGPAVQAWAGALICERRRQRPQAAEWAACLVTRQMLTSLPVSGVLDAIRLLKRVADWPLVAAAVEEGLRRWPADPRLHYEAAVLFEHRMKDPGRAMAHAVVLDDRARIVRLRSRLSRLAKERHAPCAGDVAAAGEVLE